MMHSPEDGLNFNKKRNVAMDEEKRSLIIIVSAPSGSGKTTIVQKLIEQLSGIKCSVSYTTRPPREGERDGEEYIFISKEEFKEKVDKGEFLEYEENFGNCYGTSLLEFEEARDKEEDIILSIDVKGARRIKRSFPESISIFVMPPSEEALVERLKNRNTDNKKDVLIRLKESKLEMASCDEYDYMIVNDDLAEAVRELKHIVEGERKIKKAQKGEDE